MMTAEHNFQQAKYARCVDLSKRVRWDIDDDVIRGRTLDFRQKFLPDSLSLVNELDCLSDAERLYLSQVQGRTYANLFGLIERYINAKILEVSRDHWFGDQVALEALVRFSDEELKHQELFRRIEELSSAGMRDGYQVVADANEVAKVVLSKSTWAVMALTYHVEIFTQVHFKKSIEPETGLSEVWKDVFLFHWKEESQPAVIDELEWRREDAKISEAQRNQSVTDLIELVLAVDGILQGQAKADADYFIATVNRAVSADEMESIRQLVLKAYRWQYIVSGVQDGRFLSVLTGLITEDQARRVAEALAPVM